MREQLLLNNGRKIPRIGFGTSHAKNEECVKAVKTALNAGYRLIDTAAKYDNEEAVGKGIEASGIPREEIFVTSKFWREDMGYEQAKMAFEESLGKLGLNYIDIYLIHWPANAKNYDNWQKTNADTWRAIEELQAEGKIKSIGVSNFWPEHLEALFETAKIKPALNQIEFHPGYWQPEVTKFCKEHEITVESWSPLAKAKIFNNDVLQKIAQKHQKSVAQVCLRWVLQHDVIVIPKSTTPERIEENRKIFDFELSQEEMNMIDELPQIGFSGELPNIWPEKV